MELYRAVYCREVWVVRGETRERGDAEMVIIVKLSIINCQLSIVNYEPYTLAPGPLTLHPCPLILKANYPPLPQAQF